MSDSARLFARYDTELAVRPDDIDLYQHVHSTRYLDYVLAARFDQMERCYGYSMQEFARQGLGWFMNSATIHYRRPLGLGDRMRVTTWIETLGETGVKVGFLICNIATQKTVCDGVTDYTLVSLATRRAVSLPADVRAKYGV